jgi:hypothetical protein
MTNPTAFLAAVATGAVLAVLAAMVVMLWRSEKKTGTHELTDSTDGYRPRPYDQVILGEAYISIPLPTADPEPEPEPIDELDPRWDWRAYADAAERDLVAA